MKTYKIKPAKWEKEEMEDQWFFWRASPEHYYEVWWARYNGWKRRLNGKNVVYVESCEVGMRECEEHFKNFLLAALEEVLDTVNPNSRWEIWFTSMAHCWGNCNPGVSYPLEEARKVMQTLIEEQKQVDLEEDQEPQWAFKLVESLDHIKRREIV